MKFPKNVNNKRCAPKIKFFYEIFFQKYSDIFWHRKLTLKVRILPFSTTFTQLTARIKNFLRGWWLILSLYEGLLECATVCVKSEVILIHIYGSVIHSWNISHQLDCPKQARKIKDQSWSPWNFQHALLCIYRTIRVYD